MKLVAVYILSRVERTREIDGSNDCLLSIQTEEGLFIQTTWIRAEDILL